jgi:hypothetical protein
MHGTLEPEKTSGGGLTMAISVPVASGAGVATRQGVYAEIRCRP